MDIFILTLLLLLVGFIGSFTPLIPGALLSITGITVYWWSTGFSEPGIFIMFLLYLTGLSALLFDLFAGAVGSKIGGASNKTVQMAAIGGIIFFFVAGPLGTLAGVTGVVMAREYLLTGEKDMSMKKALYTGLSVMGSALIQGFLTGFMLVVFLVTYLL